MAKDPAILWYWNDWNGGTTTFTRHLKGCYIDLLNSQFNSGRLSLAEIKTVLGADFGQAWPSLQKKFRKDENGLYYNERMEQEQEKRKRFTESRRRNLDSKNRKPLVDGHVVKSMEGHMEDVNENEDDNSNEFILPANGFFTDILDPKIELSEMDIGKTVEFLRLKHRKILTYGEVRDQWEAFKIQQLSDHTWYNSLGDFIKHFRNSLNSQIQKNGTPTTKQSNSAGSGKPSGKSAGANILLNTLREEIGGAGPG
jgi:hypothetical protein